MGVCEVDGGAGDEGRGQTKSIVSGEQYGLILLYKYHCLSDDSPEGSTSVGRMSGDVGSWQSFSLISIIVSGAVVDVFTAT